MKGLITILLISVSLTFLVNLLVFQDVPEEIREKQLTVVEQNALPINSIEFSDTNFSDLQVLDSVLSGNRILLLGESTHQDGQTFKAKSRIIRYLHERMGYEIVLYEAGQYDMWMMNEAMEASESDDLKGSVGGLGLFDFWWANEETRPLIDYYQATKETSVPLELGGFDIQFSGSRLNTERGQLLKDFLEESGLDLAEYPTLNEHIGIIHLLTFNQLAKRRLNEEGKDPLLQELADLEKDISMLEETEESLMYRRYMNDIRHNLIKSWSFETGSEESLHFRDSLMARNLIYQIDSVYKGKKIVVWCSNLHTFASRYSERFYPMGAYIKDRYGDEAYMLAFSSYARVNSGGSLVDRPGKLAVENVFHRSGSPYFLIDFRGLPASSFLRGSFVSNLNQGVDRERKWSEFVDGIFYIDINKNPTYSEK